MSEKQPSKLTPYEQHTANINRILAELDAEIEKIGKDESND